jgi:hypothetical protein
MPLRRPAGKRAGTRPADGPWPPRDAVPAAAQLSARLALEDVVTVTTIVMPGIGSGNLCEALARGVSGDDLSTVGVGRFLPRGGFEQDATNDPVPEQVRHSLLVLEALEVEEWIHSDVEPTADRIARLRLCGRLRLLEGRHAEVDHPGELGAEDDCAAPVMKSVTEVGEERRGGRAGSDSEFVRVELKREPVLPAYLEVAVVSVLDLLSRRAPWLRFRPAV